MVDKLDDNMNKINFAMRIVFFSFFMFICIFSKGQDSQKRFNEMISSMYIDPSAPKVQELKEPVNLKEQIETFINQVNKERNNNKILYVIRVYEYDTIANNYCLSISYILNSIEYSAIRPSHYFMIGTNAVVLSASIQDISSIFSTCDIKAIETENVEKFINYLTPCPNGKIVVLYEPSGMTYCKKGENIKKTYYPYIEKMPSIARFY